MYHRSGEPISWRPALDWFELLAAVFGLACCSVAPFLLKIPVRRWHLRSRPKLLRGCRYNGLRPAVLSGTNRDEFVGRKEAQKSQKDEAKKWRQKDEPQRGAEGKNG